LVRAVVDAIVENVVSVCRIVCDEWHQSRIE
jgi:hypothetical protein